MEIKFPEGHNPYAIRFSRHQSNWVWTTKEDYENCMLNPFGKFTMICKVLDWVHTEHGIKDCVKYLYKACEGFKAWEFQGLFDYYNCYHFLNKEPNERMRIFLEVLHTAGCSKEILKYNLERSYREKANPFFTERERRSELEEETKFIDDLEVYSTCSDGIIVELLA